MSVAGVLVFLLYGFVATWWGGWVFGPRYMTDMLPFFALWLARTPLPRAGASRSRSLFAAALGWSIWVYELGVRAYPVRLGRATRSPSTAAPSRLWSWRDTEIARCLAALRARR